MPKCWFHSYRLQRKPRYNSSKDMNAELANHRGNEKVSALVEQNRPDIAAPLIDDFKPEFFDKLNFYLETLDHETMKTDAPAKRIYGWIAKLDECPTALISTAADR